MNGLLVMLVTAAFMAAVEAVREWAVPQSFTRWQSHAVSIAFISLVAVAVGVKILWRGRMIRSKLMLTLEERDEALRQSEAAFDKACAASRAKGEFLANMSHEIRTPMTAILGYTDLLMAPQQSDAERQEYLTVIRRNGEHLLELINDILDLSKIEAGKLSLELRPCSLPAIIADVISMMRVRAVQRGISLTVEYVDRLPKTIEIDEAKCRQVLVNLIGNAVKFTETGGVRVRTTFLAQGRHGKPAVRIEVIDTGIGIAADKLPDLCQPFTQADSSTARKYGGTGLGLAITRRLVEFMNGELTIHSELGRGSTFELTVPTGSFDSVEMFHDVSEAIQGSGLHPRVQQPAVSLKGVRILLAEDGPDNQRLIGTILRRSGAEVTLAEDGRVAVEAALKQTFDVILMDMQMPEMDGYQATRLLREKTFRGPIIALTAHALSCDRERCMTAGCTDYLSKPIDLALLTATIARYAGRKDGSKQVSGDLSSPTSAGADRVLGSEFADDPALSDLIAEFALALPGRVQAMRDAAGHMQHQQLRQLAHQLKGAGGSYGYPALTDVARVLEQASRDEDSEGENLALAKLTTLCDAIVRGLKHAPANE